MSIRIEAPIPGRAAIGIELPNRDVSQVYIRDLIDTPEFTSQKGLLTVAIGKDITGNNVYADLAKMPHLLVGGTTGSGKSVCLNAMMISLFYRAPADVVKFIMIDPKRGVEMAKYNGIPNLVTEVVTEPSRAAGALAWAVNEMLQRYNAFKQTKARSLEAHNEELEALGKDKLPYIVIIIDEFADLMMASSKEVEDSVIRIAQLGRAAGIHLVIATQSPRADIFTGLIKANVPSRIALTVSNSLESRIIMDNMGAEKLLGRGDMLFRPIGKNKPVRVQGCWVSDDEIERVVDYLKSNSSPDETSYDPEIGEQMTRLSQSGSKSGASETAEGSGDGFEDDLTLQAIRLSVDYDGISASMLQRRLRVGYARASRLVDELEAMGIVGPSDGAKPRQLLITREEYLEKYGDTALPEDDEL